MLEKDIEAYLVKQVKKLGGEAEKFTSPQRRSVPDRLISLPGEAIFFVEVKAPGKKPTEAQERDHERRRKLGKRVFVVDTKDSVDQMLSKFEV